LETGFKIVPRQITGTRVLVTEAVNPILHIMGEYRMLDYKCKWD